MPKVDDLLKEEQDETTPEELPDRGVHHVFRGLSLGHPESLQRGYHPVEHVNQYLSSFLRAGYDLVYVQHVATTEHGIRLLYVLAK